MFKWAYLILFLFLSVFAINFSLDDSASSIADFFPSIVTIFAFLFAILTFFKWRIVYSVSKSKLSLLFITLPFIIIAIYGLCSFITYRKINTPYQLFATLPGDHNYEYYFRNDSTLKILGHFAMVDGQTFQSYQIHGDTILLDTIIPCTGIVANKYLFTSSADSTYKYLTPLNDRGLKIDSMSLTIKNKNYR